MLRRRKGRSRRIITCSIVSLIFCSFSFKHGRKEARIDKLGNACQVETGKEVNRARIKKKKKKRERKEIGRVNALGRREEREWG